MFVLIFGATSTSVSCFVEMRPAHLRPAHLRCALSLFSVPGNLFPLFTPYH